MRVRALSLCAVAALSLAACEKKTGAPPASQAVASAPAAQAADATASPQADAGPLAREAPPAPLPLPQLAYAYKYALAAPAQAVRRLMARHEQVCWAAGPATCQVVGSSVSEEGHDDVHGTLTIRAQPEWLRRFRAGLDDDTKALGGRTISADTSSDDLARSLVDTDASLRSQEILRDRLEQTLRTRKGKVSEVFELEKQLAEVRGQIDATRSGLALMKGKVAGSTLTIDYRSANMLAPSGKLAPISEAAGDVVGILAFIAAFLIRVAALLGPFAGLGALVWWLTRRSQSRAEKKPAA